MTDTLTLNGSEKITVLSGAPGRFEVLATYEPHGERPPLHIHPTHTESFTMLDGVLHVDIAGKGRDYRAGESFEVLSGVRHRMWNAGELPATVRWISSPAGRVESFFRAIDALHRGGRTSVVAKAGVLREYRDVIRPSSAVTRVLVSILGAFRPAADVPVPASGDQVRSRTP